MPMRAFAALIVVANFSQPCTAIEERILQAVRSRRDKLWNAPKYHFHDYLIVVIDTLVKEQFGFHLMPMMAL